MGGKARVKNAGSPKERTGACRSANALLLFAAQLHPTRASKAQSQAAGKLEERSEGEGPDQLSQRCKDRLCSSAGGGGSLGGRNPPKAGSCWTPSEAGGDAQPLVPPLSRGLLLCPVEARPTFGTLLVSWSHHPWAPGRPLLSCPRADGSAFPSSGSGAAFGKLPRSGRGRGRTLFAREPFFFPRREPAFPGAKPGLV